MEESVNGSKQSEEQLARMVGMEASPVIEEGSTGKEANDPTSSHVATTGE